MANFDAYATMTPEQIQDYQSYIQQNYPGLVTGPNGVSGATGPGGGPLTIGFQPFSTNTAGGGGAPTSGYGGWTLSGGPAQQGDANAFFPTYQSLENTYGINPSWVDPTQFNNYDMGSQWRGNMNTNSSLDNVAQNLTLALLAYGGGEAASTLGAGGGAASAEAGTSTAGMSAADQAALTSSTSGGIGSATLAGGAGSDTLGGGTMASTGYFDDFTGQWVDTSGGLTDSTMAGGGGLQLGGAPGINSMGGASGLVAPAGTDFAGGTTTAAVGQGGVVGGASGGLDFASLAQQYGPDVAKAIAGLFAGGGGSSTSSLFGGGGGPSLGSMLPGVAALGYAASQNPIDTGQLQNVYNAAGANAPLFTQAAIAPAQQAQAAGYGDLLQSQGLRGVRGSSFGDTDIANYLNSTNTNIGNIGANAAQQSLGLQGNLAGNIAQLNAQSQQMKNQLYGTAFDVLGRGLNPGGYAGNINIGGQPVNSTTSTPNTGTNWGSLANLAPLAAKYGGTAYNWLTG